MEWHTSFLVAIGLAMDAFAVSVGVGTGGQAVDFRSRFRLAAHFGIFQGGMTLLGWAAGSTVAGLIQDFDHWIALALLAYVGINMIRSGLCCHEEGEQSHCDPTRGGAMLLLCVATSIDALAVGLSMAMLGASVFQPALVIGVVTFGLSAFGLRAGGHLGKTFGKRMEVLGGLILISIGLRVLFSHLMA